jgi:hypothetical protein
MEKGVKDFAQNVEQLVDRVVSGDLALELTQHADKMVSGFIRGFEVRSHACNCCALSTVHQSENTPVPMPKQPSDNMGCSLWEMLRCSTFVSCKQGN